MANRRFSPVTYALVGISLVMLYFVGKMVTPPPAAPPAPPVAASPPPGANAAMPDSQARMGDAKVIAQQASQERAARMHAMSNGMQSHPSEASKKPAFNPSSIETTADYWHNHDMGENGVKTMRAKVAHVEEEQKHAVPAPIHKGGPALPIPAP